MASKGLRLLCGRGSAPGATTMPVSLEAGVPTNEVSQSLQPIVYGQGDSRRMGGFLAVESGHLALAGAVESGANVVYFETSGF